METQTHKKATANTAPTLAATNQCDMAVAFLEWFPEDGFEPLPEDDPLPEELEPVLEGTGVALDGLLSEPELLPM